MQFRDKVLVRALQQCIISVHDCGTFLRLSVIFTYLLFNRIVTFWIFNYANNIYIMVIAPVMV